MYNNPYQPPNYGGPPTAAPGGAYSYPSYPTQNTSPNYGWNIPQNGPPSGNSNPGYPPPPQPSYPPNSAYPYPPSPVNNNKPSGYPGTVPPNSFVNPPPSPLSGGGGVSGGIVGDLVASITQPSKPVAPSAEKIGQKTHQDNEWGGGGRVIPITIVGGRDDSSGGGGGGRDPFGGRSPFGSGGGGRDPFGSGGGGRDPFGGGGGGRDPFGGKGGGGRDAFPSGGGGRDPFGSGGGGRDSFGGKGGGGRDPFPSGGGGRDPFGGKGGGRQPPPRPVPQSRGGGRNSELESYIACDQCKTLNSREDSTCVYCSEPIKRRY